MPNNITIPIEEYKTDTSQRTWDLPAWGHPLSKMVLPLFITSHGFYRPIGTAFWFGRGISFVFTATHNVLQALRDEGRFDQHVSSGNLPENFNLNNSGLCVLHQNDTSPTQANFTMTPLVSVHGAPPTDVSIGHPVFVNNRQTISLPLSFTPPSIGEPIWSFGYTDFHPSEISIADVQSGNFDWAADYQHRLVVTEGIVKFIFIRHFAHGFIDGPCFTFDNTIAHGQSGGPVITKDGRIIGINSASAESFFDSPMSLGSMLYPLVLTKIKFGASLGLIRMDRVCSLLELIAEERILTDGSEMHLGFFGEGENIVSVCTQAPAEDCSSIYDDFGGFQRAEAATRQTGPVYRLVKTRPRE